MVSSTDLSLKIKADKMCRESRLASCQAPGISHLTAAYIKVHTHNELGILQE
jgi:hypothetical protein